MTSEITRRGALTLGVSAAALAVTGAKAQTPASAVKAADVAAACAADRERRELAHAAPGALRPGRRGRVPRQRQELHGKDRRRGQGRLRRLGRHQPADRGDVEFRRRPRHHHRLRGRAAYLCRQADRADRRRRLSRQEIWWLADACATLRQAQQEHELDRAAVRRHRRAAGLSQIGGASRRLRQGAGRSRRHPRSLPQAESGRQAGGLRARQRCRRRQRVRAMDSVVAQRGAAGRRAATSSSTARKPSRR